MQEKRLTNKYDELTSAMYNWRTKTNEKEKQRKREGGGRERERGGRVEGKDIVCTITESGTARESTVEERK